MTRASRRKGKGGLELIEEAVHLLRTAPAATLGLYYVGALPFALGLLYFWADMGRSPFAQQHLAEAALGVAALFVWRQFWQALFTRQLRASLSGAPAPRPSGQLCRRTWLAQCALQPTGLFVLPLAVVPLLSFPWVYAFYQSLTVLAGEEPTLRALVRRAASQAALWPRQNFVALAILTGFGLYVLLNWITVGFLLPGLAKMLLGVESVFTRSSFSMLNTTFFAAVFFLTHLCVDPICKAVYALRCFYGSALQSGDDLRVELRRSAAAASPAVAGLLLLGLSSATCQALTQVGELQLRECARNDGAVARLWAIAPPRTVGSRSQSGVAATAVPGAQELKAAAGIPPAALDRTIEEVIRQNKYTWRAPREKLVAEQTSQGVVGRFLERVRTMLRNWLKSVGEWIGRWLRRLFGGWRGGMPGTGGFGWGLRFLLYLLLLVAVVALLLLAYRFWRASQRPAIALAGDSLSPAPDLADENVGAEQWPEDAWMKLARELWEQGELRLAMRAFYFSSLAGLASRNLINLAKFKSNREYQRELERRGHAFPELRTVFEQNVSVFDAIWYGLHAVDGDLVRQFASNVERLRGNA